jgi:hypothetical protein
MDFSTRNSQAAPAPAAPTHAAGPVGGSKKGKVSSDLNWSAIGFVAGIVVVAILIIAVIVGVSSPSVPKENKYVDSTKLQAVFLNTGQVYFGKIKELNAKYFVVSNIYYLQTSGGSSTTSTTAANTSVSLVKLGCELHEPYDQMVINRDQVTFWENLQDNGQVAQAVKTFVKQNPSGQKCADQSSSAGTNSVNSTQNAGSGNATPSTGTTPSTSTTKP